MFLKSTLAVLLALAPAAAHAETALLAVASNFAPTAEKLAKAYETASGDQIDITAGATGKLYAQIEAGAPFDALLSADRKTPEKAVAAGLATKESEFTYAAGRLALWSASGAVDQNDPARALTEARHIAIANPDLAPYGKAAMQALDKLGLTAQVQDKLVTGENIAQAQTMVASGAAEVGFVAASSVTDQPAEQVWLVPEADHDPLMQDAVLLKHGQENSAARGFMAYLASDAAREIIRQEGYSVP